MLLPQLLTHREEWIRKFATFLVEKGNQYQFLSLYTSYLGRLSFSFIDIRAYSTKGKYTLMKFPEARPPYFTYDFYIEWLDSPFNRPRHYRQNKFETIIILLEERSWDPPLDL